jgi:hypothetical protein
MTQIPASLPPFLGGQRDAFGLIRRLETGALLTGRVLRSGAEGSTPIQIGHAVLTLILSEPVPPGTLVEVRSEDGKILVEPKDQPNTPGQSSNLPSHHSSQSTVITAGLPPGGTALAPVLAKVLQSHNLPATLENLQILQAALGGFPPEQGPVLALLLARNVPITAENLALVRERLRARGNLGKELGKLSGEIGTLLKNGSIRGSDRLATLLVDLQNLLSWDQTGELGERVEHLKDFLSSLEEKLLGLNPEKARGDFKGMLLELDFLLSQADLDRNDPLRSSVRKVVYLLEGAHLTGLTQVGEPDRSAWVFWRFPFPGDPSPTTVELALRGDRDPDHPEQYDAKNLEVLIQVDLSVLGPLRVRLRSLNEELKITLSVIEKRFRDYILKELPLLAAALNDQGFRNVLTDIRVESIAPGSLADEIDPLKDWERRFEEPPPTVDIRL